MKTFNNVSTSSYQSTLAFRTGEQYVVDPRVGEGSINIYIGISYRRTVRGGPKGRGGINQYRLFVIAYLIWVYNVIS